MLAYNAEGASFEIYDDGYINFIAEVVRAALGKKMAFPGSLDKKTEGEIVTLFRNYTKALSGINRSICIVCWPYCVVPLTMEFGPADVDVVHVLVGYGDAFGIPAYQPIGPLLVDGLAGEPRGACDCAA